MIIKRNRGRQWLDWQRRLVTSAHYIGAAVCLLLLVVLLVPLAVSLLPQHLVHPLVAEGAA